METRGLRKNLETIPGKHSTDPLQKTATLGKSQVIRKELQSESWSLGGGDHCWFKSRSAGKKRPVTREDDDDDDDNNNNNNNKIKIIIIWPYKTRCRQIASNAWLKTDVQFPETTEFVRTIQDHFINSNNYKKYILKGPNTNTAICRKCRAK